ncbi:hypothetical protein B0A55_07767 [Friedmanniomyces simplex]|uniref:Uncharacterized protein n=1 Tax=Friedmanniomyces simplex TaxID=329884 RepID=A0A4U0X502_9PEZI|nr:hypothetical protein B0A55_07767 [Friedmanniomyces simplex]
MLTTRNISTIGSENEAWLVRMNALSPPKPNGYRTVSRASYLSLNSSSADDSIEIPSTVDSVEGLQFCGFNATAAHEVYERYTTSENILGHGLGTFAVGYISGRASQRNAVLPTDGWDEALAYMDLTRRKRDALLKPEYKDFRMLGTAETWAKEIVADSYEWLLDLDRIITYRRSQRGQNPSVRPYSPSLNVTPSPAIEPTSRPSSSSGQLPYPLLETSVVLPTEIPEYTMLYKGGTTRRLEKVWADGTGGRLELPNLYSKPPTDFHPQNPHILYFTKQKQCAEVYAKMAEDIKDPVPAGILHVAVPKEMLSQAISIVGTDFKQLVFESRTQNPRGSVSAHLQHYTTASLLVGPICGVSSDVLTRHAQTADDVTLLGIGQGAKASQYAFQGNDMADELNDKCEGMVWLEEMSCRGVGTWRKAREEVLRH